MSMSKLTVRFEDPFWVGIIEVEGEGDYRVARHVFGAEPTTPEVLRFVCDEWRELRFTDGIQIQVEQAKRINPKRLRRMIEKEIRSSARRGTKAQQALAEQHRDRLHVLPPREVDGRERVAQGVGPRAGEPRTKARGLFRVHSTRNSSWPPPPPPGERERSLVPRAYPRRGQTAPAGGGGAPPRLRSATLRAGDPPRPCGGSAASRPSPKEASRRLERRPKQMHLRMSERELAAAKALAGELDMTVSDLVRVLLQLPADSVGTGARLVVVDRTTAAKLSREMTRWGHHYNQAVHALNAIAYYLRANDMDAPDVLEELARAERKLEEMRPAVDSLRREVAELSRKALAALWR